MNRSRTDEKELKPLKDRNHKDIKIEVNDE
jgi:hypothetical protein